MKHEVDLKKYHLRTDLIDELSDNIVYEKTIKNIKITDIYLDKKQAKYLNKKVGNYITITFDDITDYNNKEQVKNVFYKELHKLLKKLNLIDKKTLIIGLGNINSTPDSLGPLSINNIIVTKHISDLGKLEKGFSVVSSFIPGVTGSTGIETSDLIKGLKNIVKPDYIIVIDSLATSSIKNLIKTIQITDTGINPGSGVGNNRKEISKNTLNIPVIAIGVPTVVDANTIVSEAINSSFNSYSDLMVTPKEIDFIIDKLADIIGNGINKTLHKNI